MKQNILPLLALFLSTGSIALAAKPVLRIDETMVRNFALDQSPALLQSRANFNASNFQLRQVQQKYQANLQFNSQFQDSNENQINNFAPTFRHTSNFSTSINKKTKYGVSLGTGLFAQQQNSADGRIFHAAQFGAQVNFTIDLWKNFLGKIDRAELRSQDFLQQRRELEASLLAREVELEARKIYWNLVANRESLSIAKRLLDSAVKQYAEIKRRRRDGDADSGDLARAAAQVESRKTTIFRFEKEQVDLLAALRRQIPAINRSEVSLAVVDVDAFRVDVLACIAQIQQEGSKTLDYTKLPELVNFLYKEQSASHQRNQALSGADLKFIANAQTTGVNQGYGDAFQNTFDDFTRGYNASLQLNIPLGSKDKKTRQAKEQLDREMYIAQIETTKARLEVRFRQTYETLKLLNQTLTSIELNSTLLEKNLKSAERKYRQARIDINTLIQQQDTYFNSLLSEVNTNVAILFELYDFFKVFTEHPCKLNKLEG